MIDDFLNPLMTEVNMILETSEVKVLAVEGLTDMRYFEDKVNADDIAVYDCNGRKNVTEVVKEFHSKFKNRINGICDRDFLDFKIGSHKGKDILHTDYHDLEMDAIEYSNIESILTMLFSEEKLKNKNIKKKTALKLIFDMTYLLGNIRLINEIESYNISFDEYKLRKGVAYDNSFKCSPLSILKCVLRPKTNSKLMKDIDTIETVLKSELKKKHDYKQICCGHDFMKVLLEFTKLFGVGKSSKIPDEQFIGNIILGMYDKGTFIKSKLGKRLKTKKYI